MPVALVNCNRRESSCIIEGYSGGKEMLIHKPTDIRYSEITPKHIYMNRRRFLVAVPAAFLGARALAGTKLPNVQKSQYTVNEKQNSYQDVSTYNNYYEFGTDKGQPAENDRSQ